MPSTHTTHLQTCLSLARKSPPKPTNFRVGALLLLRPVNPNPDSSSSSPSEEEILSTGYTLELTGNTHAEQCALAKYATEHNLPEERVGEVLPSTPEKEVVIYTTLEPCGKRLSGNISCVQRIIRTRKDGKRGG
jgi:pyrimidine deaminase RibD-like protein